jgi:hypothetical protein
MEASLTILPLEALELWRCPWRDFAMTPQTDRLESEILALFRQACRQNRLDVAEHLLRALETLARKPCIQADALSRCTLTEAYRDLVHTH